MQLICSVRKLLIMTSKLGAYLKTKKATGPTGHTDNLTLILTLTLTLTYVKKTSSLTDSQCRVRVRMLELGLG